MQNEINDVLRLIAHLLQYEKKLLSGENKLVLQSNMLHNFNAVLNIVENTPSDIIIYHADRKSIECFEKLLNKVPKLLITQRSIHSHNNIIDIRHFKKLKHLELERVPFDKVKGLNVLKPQLEYLQCNHCSNVEIITKIGKLQWSELVTLKLTNSQLIVDYQFFDSMPWIQNLDLSFAKLRNLDALRALDNLKVLNISFNHLEKLPTLSPAACGQLQILLINHNYLQDLEGLQYFTNLRGLDLAWNWITEKRTLSHLLNLKSLQWINMRNTPISFSKYYRIYLAAAIGSSSASDQFVIDNKSLNRREQELMGTGLGIIRCGKSLYNSADMQAHCSLHSNETLPSNPPFAFNVPSTSIQSSPLNPSLTHQLSIKKGSRVRKVVIEDISGEEIKQPTVVPPDIQNVKEDEAINNIPTKTEIVETTVNEGAEDYLINSLIKGAAAPEKLEKEEEERELGLGRKELELLSESNVTLGILEVEIHDPKYNEKTEPPHLVLDLSEDKLNENHEGNKQSVSSHCVEDSEPCQQLEILNENIKIEQQNHSNNNNIKNDSANILDQSGDNLLDDTDDQTYYSATDEKDTSKTIYVSEHYIGEKDQKSDDCTNFNDPTEQAGSAGHLDIGIEHKIETCLQLNDHEISKHECNDNDKQNDPINILNQTDLSIDQDDQDYYSITDERDRSKTLSSTDSGDLAKSRETIDSFESHQDGQTFISNLEDEDRIDVTLSSIGTPMNKSSPNQKETIEKEIRMDTDRDSESECSDTSDVEDELWLVKKVDNKTNNVENMLLALLENGIKERSPLSGRTITRWSFDSVQSCVKTKNEPFTVELEFDNVKPDKLKRTYIMEFSDAQVLIKKMYNVLESRPLSAMNQSTFKCLKCESIFVHSIPGVVRSKASQIRCTICSSLTVMVMEEPKPPDVSKISSSKPISHSPSQSSIALDREKPGCGSSASSNLKISCSAASLEQGQKLGAVPVDTNLPRKYESDIEIISNPSQSSVEILDEFSRSQGSTPCRKRSSEERQIVAVPQLGTVLEASAHLTALTESSSSGSLTESVITTYETQNVINKKPKPEESLIEESREGSPETELDTASNTQENLEENGNITQNKTTYNMEIYNYNDYSQVDVRIKLFLYQTIFHDENEELLLLVKCHLWKTGGTDYDACVVFSTSKIYFLSHSITKFQEDTCDWLTLDSSYLLKDLKKIYPLIWNQGAVLNINKITYLILFMDKERSSNFFKFLEGLSMKILKVQNNVSTETELILQQAVLSSDISREAVDPTITAFTLCSKICINKDDEEEIMRLGGLVITGSEFHIVPGNLSWLCLHVTPSIHISQHITCLIDVERTRTSIKFHFLDEEEAVEEIWTIILTTIEQTSLIIDAIKTAWGNTFSVPLEITEK